MKKIVINTCFGGFGLSSKALLSIATKKGVPLEDFEYYDLPRDDPDLVAVVEELGSSANWSVSNLKIVEIPDGLQWGIEEYDGIEWVAEEHRTWS